MASLVVEARLQDHQVITVDKVDKAVFLVDASGPGSCEHVTKCLWLPDSRDGLTQGVIDQPLGSFECRAVRSEPIGVRPNRGE